MKSGREKGEKCKRKRKKGEAKGRKGKEKEVSGSKRGKLMQNREKLRQKGHNRTQKPMCYESGKNIFRRGGGIMVFGPKYRPLRTILYHRRFYLDRVSTVSRPSSASRQYAVAYFAAPAASHIFII
jgi:hypothetical protein